MNKRLTEHYEFEKYVCGHFGDLEQLSNKLYYKVLKWEKKGMGTRESFEETKKWLIYELESKSDFVEVLCKKWIHAIDVDWEEHTGTEEWLYLIETCNILIWLRLEINMLDGKILDVENARIVKYPSEE